MKLLALAIEGVGANLEFTNRAKGRVLHDWLSPRYRERHGHPTLSRNTFTLFKENTVVYLEKLAKLCEMPGIMAATSKEDGIPYLVLFRSDANTKK
jgi:hypothetical protein